MKLTKRYLTIIFATLLLICSSAVVADAQQKSQRLRINRPVVVRNYYYVRHNPYWYWNSWRNPYFYDSYYFDPYLNAQRQRYYLENELRGNKRELRKHLEKYNADGVITAEERRELEDDYRDVAKAQRKLNEFNRGE